MLNYQRVIKECQQFLPGFPVFASYRQKIGIHRTPRRRRSKMSQSPRSAAERSRNSSWMFFVAIRVCLKMLCTPLYPMVLLIMIPMKNGDFIGNINPTFSDKPINGKSPANQQKRTTFKWTTLKIDHEKIYRTKNQGISKISEVGINRAIPAGVTRNGPSEKERFPEGIRI